MILDDLRHVTDPDEALRISTAGLRSQHSLDEVVARISQELHGALWREDHIAARLQHMRDQRR